MESQSHNYLLYVLPILFIVSLRIWFSLRRRNTNQRLPPGPPKLPFIGNMHLFVGAPPHLLFRDLSTKYGEVVHLKLGELSFILISAPETAKQVMQIHDIDFASRPYSLAADVLLYNLGDIAFAPYGDYWRRIRKTCILALLSSEKVKSFRSIRENEVLVFARAVSSTAGLPTNLTHLLYSTSNFIISRAALGRRGNLGNRLLEITRKTSRETTDFSLVDLFPSIKLLKYVTGVHFKLASIRQEVDEILEDIINAHLEGRAADEEEDLLDVLLRTRDEGDHDFPLTTDNIKAIILDCLIGGSDTVAATSEWAMSEMLKTPRVLEKAQEEVRRVFEAKRSVDETELDELRYLKLIVKETLRLHAPFFAARQNEDQCEISGYDIPAKSRVLINLWAIGRDPRYWNEPETFIPERFIHSSADFRGGNFEFIPFGSGRRMCPGISFGAANVVLILATLLHHFDWTLPNGQKTEELDMAEAVVGAIRRKTDLILIPIQRYTVVPS